MNKKTPVVNPDESSDELKRHPFELEIQKNLLALQETYNRYWNLYEFAPMGYFCLDEKKIISDVNYTGASLLGIEKSKLLKKNAYQVLLRKTTAPHFQNIANMLLTAIPNKAAKYRW